MKKNLIQRISDNLPRYKIEDLHVGKIIYIQKKAYSGQSRLSETLLGYMLSMQYEYTYKQIKPFAIFRHRSGHAENYLHIVSNHELRAKYNAHEGEYAVLHTSLEDFDRAMQEYMIKNNLKKSSRLSVNQIKELEKFIKKMYNENRIYYATNDCGAFLENYIKNVCNYVDDLVLVLRDQEQLELYEDILKQYEYYKEKSYLKS